MTSVDLEPAAVVGQLIAERRSCRGFLPTPIPRDVWERLLTTSQRSASWCNTQPWELVITEGAATDRLREALREHLTTPGGPDIPFPESYTGAYQERRRACAWQLYESVGIAKGDRVASQAQTIKNFEFFDAPSAIIVTTTATLGTYGAVDCGVYLGNLMICAQSLGLGTIAQAALALHAPLLRSHFGLAPDRQVLCGISIGYPDHEHPANSFRTHRAPIDQVATFHST